MKHTLSLIALCCTFHVHAMFQFNAGTAKQITTMLDQFKEVAVDNAMTQNPAAIVYDSMQTTINTTGLSNLAAQQTVNNWMLKMHGAYKADQTYTAALTRAQTVSKEKGNPETQAAWRNVMMATIASLTATTESNSTFKCPRSQNPDYKIQFKHVLDINQNAKIEDGDVWIASTLMLFYQMQEGAELMKQAHS